MRYTLILICFLLASCATNRMIETDLYFGLTKPGGGEVTNEEWNSFKANSISAVFKEGSTDISATGSWRDPQTGKLITEPSRVIICVHKRSDVISKQIDSLRELYKKLYKQQAVLRVDKKVSVSF